ncbi:hypothetical protein BG004_003976 [Podila humilis]|nr:hypothetical protein BG004_003976 [Podila humilis]
MFRLVSKRLAVNRELESLKQEFNQCSLPIEFVYRIVVSCVDEIMERGLNHSFILRNPCSPSVVGAMLTLMADPARRVFFSLKCMRIDTVAGVMLAVLKNLREAIVPMEIQEELTSGNINKINTVNSLLNHPRFPAVNRALLMELLNLSLAILNKSTFNHMKPDMLASILGSHIFASQHATILQHTPQQAYSFGWGVALVNDIKRCSKMFYVLLGGYRREVLGTGEWEYDHLLHSATPSGLFPSSGGTPLSAASSRGQVDQWLGATSAAHHGSGMCSTGRSSQEEETYFNQDPHINHHQRQRMSRSNPQLRMTTEYRDGGLGGNGGLRSSVYQSGTGRKVSTTLSESIRAQAAQEARHWDRGQSGSGPAALEHLRGRGPSSSRQSQQPPPSSQHQYRRGNYGGYQGIPQQQHQQQQHSQYQNRQDPFHDRLRRNDAEGNVNELEQVFRRHNIHYQQEDIEHRIDVENGQSGFREHGFRERADGSNGDGEEDATNGLNRQKEQKRQAMEQMIRECRGAGMHAEARDSADSMEVPRSGYEQRGSYGGAAM